LTEKKKIVLQLQNDNILEKFKVYTRCKTKWSRTKAVAYIKDKKRQKFAWNWFGELSFCNEKKRNN